jgi:redox-sensitive bicupin YhaK (pirin superfamily)
MPANEAGQPIRGLQLWLNLPADQKMIAPRFQNLEATSIPEEPLPGGGRVRVIAGTYQGRSGGATEIATDPLYLDVSLEAEGRIEIELPERHQAFAYGLSGTASDGATTFSKRELAVFTKGTRLTLTAGPTATRFILVAAMSLGEPVARYGPFVMTTQKEIVEAIKDYREGRF